MPAHRGHAGHLHRLLPGGAAEGPAKFLFMPLALSVVFSMLASYVLSRRWCRPWPACCVERATTAWRRTSRRGRFAAVQRPARPAFERFQDGYGGCSALVLRHRGFVLFVRGAVLRGHRSCLPLFVGTDFFPAVDAGHHEAALPRPRRHAASRRPSRSCSRSRRRSATIIPDRRAPDHQRQDRRAALYNLALRPHDNVSSDGRRDPDPAQARAPPDRRLHARDPRRSCRRTSPAARSTSSPPTSSARCSTSACRRRSTSRSRARDLGTDLRPGAAPAAGRAAEDSRHRTCASRRCSTTPRSRWTSTASAPRSSAWPSAMSPTTC